MNEIDATQRKVVKYEIAKLKQHPRQKEVFANLSVAQIEELARSLELEGQKQPIEILSDGTIVCGHQRTHAARRLGWTQIDAVVRTDLENLGDAAVFDLLVRDNLEGRQLDELEVAKCYLKLKENNKRLPKERRAACKGMDLRDQLAKRFKMSGRNLDRLKLVLDSPKEVQKAVSAKKLSIQQAGKVAPMPLTTQNEIAERIAMGENPETVVKEYVTPAPNHHKKFVARKKAFFRHCEGGLAELQGLLTKDDLKILRKLTPERACS